MSTLTQSTQAGPAGSKLKPGSYFPALDGLRAFAFALVFLNHYWQVPFTWVGVDIFFVLSGFLITGILFDSQDHPHRYSNFYIRRTLRIFPLYYGVMAAVLLSQTIFSWRLDWSWIVWPGYLGNYVLALHPPGSHLTLLADAQLWSNRFSTWLVLYFGHFWSLCVEEQFYLVWPWVVFTVRDRKRLIWISVAVVLFSPLLRQIAVSGFPPRIIDANVIYKATPFRLDSLILGGLVALILRGGHLKELLRVARIVLLTLGPVAAIAVHFALTGRIALNSIRVYGFTVIAVLAAALIILALESGSAIFKVLTLAPMRWFGSITYGAYVFHDIYHAVLAHAVQHAFHRVPRIASLVTQQDATALLAIPVTIALAYLSHKYLEMPFIGMKDRFTQPSSKVLGHARSKPATAHYYQH